MNKVFEIIGKFIIVLIVLTILNFVLFTLPLMWLWNWLMPMIFGLPVITFWQAFGIIILSNLLFKSINVNNKDV